MIYLLWEQHNDLMHVVGKIQEATEETSRVSQGQRENMDRKQHIKTLERAKNVHFIFYFF